MYNICIRYKQKSIFFGVSKKAQNLFLFSLIVLFVSTASSQTKQSEKRLSDASGEYSFAPPSDFASQQSDEGFEFRQ